MAHYWKRDSEKGFIEDTAYIKYEKFNNLRHSVIGFMLGDFDQQGNYVVSPEIKRELIVMPKYIVESMDNIEICKSELKLNKQISFMVTFEGNRVTLSLLEKINYQANYKLNSGSYSNVNEYILDQIETSGVVNRNVIYERWNIKPFGSHEVDIFNCDEAVLEKYFGIVRRFKYLMVANTKLLNKEKEIEEIESAYANKMFEILKAYPALNKIVMEEIKQTFKEKKKFVTADQPNFAKTLNEIVDVATEQNLEVMPASQQELFKVEKRNLVVETNLKKEEVLDIQERTQDLNKEDLKFNKKHGSENENEVPIVTVVVANNELEKPVEKIALEFASTQKHITEEVKNNVIAEVVEEKTKETLNVDDSNESEREVLIDKMLGVVGEDVLISEATNEIITKRVEEINNTDKTSTAEETVEKEAKQVTEETNNLVNSATERHNSWATDGQVDPPFKYGYGNGEQSGREVADTDSLIKVNAGTTDYDFDNENEDSTTDKVETVSDGKATGETSSEEDSVAPIVEDETGKRERGDTEDLTLESLNIKGGNIVENVEVQYGDVKDIGV